MDNEMSKTDKNQMLKKAAQLLRFALSTNDEELIKSIVESVAEMLEEEID
jgi:tRNA A37 N6-isopentenylltransferase MiaA